jgi:hypothetical protein
MPAADDTAWVDVLPSMQRFVPELRKALGSSMSAAGKQAGADFSQALQRQAVAGVEAASDKLAAARNKEADAAGKLRIAEQKLQELRASGKAKSSQLTAAEEALARAQRGVADSMAGSERAARGLANAQDRAAEAARTGANGLADVDRKAGAATRTFGGMKAVVGGAFGAFYAVQGVTSLLGGALGAASDLSETVNKSNTIFGANAAAVNAWAQNSARSVGLSRGAALEAAAGFGNMFTQLGFAGDQAAELSTEVVQMSADLGSFNNLPTADVADRISAAFRGEYDSLQSLIPNINAARVESEALAMTGKENADALTAQEKAAAVLAIVQKDGAAAMGDFARTSDGLANSQKILSAEWDNAKARLGDLLMGPMTAIVQWTSGTLLPVLGGAWTEITGALTAFGAAWRYNDGDVTSSGLPGFFERLGYIGRQTWDFLIGAVRSFTAAWQYNDGEVTSSGFNGWMERLGYVARQTFDFLSGTAIPALVNLAQWFGQNTWALGLLVGGLVTVRAAMAAHAATMAVAAAGGIAQWIAQTSLAQTITRAWTAVQWAFNAAMSANPLALVVIALAALTAAVVIAYQRSETFRNIVQAALAAVAEAGRWMWENVLKPTWAALQDAWNAVASGISWAWNNIIRPVWDFIAAAAQALFIATAVVVFGPMLLAWKVLSEGVQWAWENLLRPTWDAVAAGAQWLWDSVLRPVFDFIGRRWDGLLAAMRSVWENVLRPTWDAVRVAAEWLWNTILRPVFDAIGRAWDGLANGMRSVYTGVIAPIFDWFGRVLDTIKNSFSTAVDWIGRTWDGLKERLRGPVQWVVDVVWNNGLRSLWNTINNLWGGEDLSPFRFASGGVMPAPRHTGVQAFADGGVMSGYTPGRDVHRFFSPTGGLLELSGGEAVLRPEVTRALGVPTVNYWNQLARQEGEAGLRRAMAGGTNRQAVQSFASGGIISLPGWLSTALDWVPGLGGVSDLVGRINSGNGFGGGLFGSGLLSLAKTVGGKLLDAAQALFGGGGGASPDQGFLEQIFEDGSVRRVPVTGSGTWQTMWGIIRAAMPWARLTSAFRPGDPGYHGRGRAIDLAGSRPGDTAAMSQINRWIAATHPNSTELIYTPGINLYRGRRHTYSPAVRADHWDHVHWAMAKGGIFSPKPPAVFHRGGVVPDYGSPDVPAWLTPDERVLTPPQDRYTQRLIAATIAAERPAEGRSGPLVNVERVESNVDLELFARKAEFRERMGSFG